MICHHETLDDEQMTKTLCEEKKNDPCGELLIEIGRTGKVACFENPLLSVCIVEDQRLGRR